ncbi:uncharacterized protein TNIN_238921 [Trichonephila inaurata madagascariensis]|uniref:Uncharacterized protein n=1 Tax=Trichonephila inaurata madagascariensis TaxID=2747483 RepID=A0A8X6XUL3_9ARAC|nr:uncharacterized protein TNIN_238921 [Trichonephila inaurata madagascariensis]
MHPLLENINLFDISSLTDENVKDILTEARVLPEKTSTPMCPICGNETSANRDSSRKLGWMWICKKKYQLKCSGKVNPTSNTFFENVRIHILDVFVLIVCFVIKLQISLVLDQLNMFRKRRGQQEMSWATIVDFYARLREVTEIIGSHHDKLLGGPGKTILLDETFLTKRKYNKGRKTKTMTQVVLGIYCRTRLNTLKSLDAKVQMFLEDISWVFPGYGKEGLQLRKLEVPTVESEGISDMMPKTFNKNLLNALSDDDDEVPFVDDEDGDPNWEEF